MATEMKNGRWRIVFLGFVVLLCGCSSGDASLHSEKIIDWTEYEVTDSHELTFTAITGDPQCFNLRIVAKETDGYLEVAVVEGVLPDAPKHCTAVGRIEKLTVTTEAPAQNLNIRALPAGEVELNP